MITREEYRQKWQEYKSHWRNKRSRDTTEMMRDALRSLPCSKTHIQYAANLSVTKTSELVKLALEKELIRVEITQPSDLEDRRTAIIQYHITSRGRDYINAFEIIENLLK